MRVRRALRRRDRRSLPRGFFRRPRGYLDRPEAGTELPRGCVTLFGWCLFPGTSVAHVEVSVAGRPFERARPAMDRPELLDVTQHPDAPICAFEHKPDLSELALDLDQVTVRVAAYALDGRRFELDPVEYPLAPPGENPPPSHPDATKLRARSVQHLRRFPRRTRGGLRLVAFSHCLPHGGGSLYLFELLRRLAREQEVECEVVTLVDGPLRPALEDLGIPVHVTDSFPVTGVQRYEGHVAELAAFCALRGFDVALVNTLDCFSGADAALRLGIPAVWTIHESFSMPQFWYTAFPPGQPHPYVAQRAEQSLKSVAATVFVADATRRLLLPYVNPDRSITLPYGLELEEIDAYRHAHDRATVRSRLGVASDAQLVLCLGTVEPRKSQALLAQAFAAIAGRHPRAELALVGATDDEYSASYRHALREYLRRAELLSRVRVVPVTTDPYSWHVAADALVCSSDIESLPRSLTEAMAFGTPVVSTRVFGVEETVVDEETGYLCEPRDVSALAAALDRALSAPADERAAMTEAARRHVRERHDAARQAERLLSLLRGVAEDPEALPAALVNAPALAHLPG